VRPLLIEAAVLGGLSAAGFGLTYTRLPDWAKDIITEHPLVTDVLATGATYKILGGTLTALTSAGIVSVLISGALFLPRIGRWFGSNDKAKACQQPDV
jgi:hypothetical protein